MSRKISFLLGIFVFGVIFPLQASESLLQEYYPAKAAYVTLFDVPKLTRAPIYAVMKKAGWDLAKDSAGGLVPAIGTVPDDLVEAVMVAGTRRNFLSFVRSNKKLPHLEKLIYEKGAKIPFFTYPPDSPVTFRVYYGNVYFVPLTPYVTAATRSKSKVYLQEYLNRISLRGRGHEPFLHEMRLFPKENVFFRAVASPDGGLLARIPGLQTCRKLTAYASVPGGARLYMQGRFLFDDVESPKFASQLLRQYQILLTMLIASDDDALLERLEKAFRYKIEGKVLLVEFVPDESLTRELIAVMAKRGTDILLKGSDPKKLFRMPSGRNKRKE